MRRQKRKMTEEEKLLKRWPHLRKCGPQPLNQIGSLRYQHKLSQQSKGK